MCAGQGNRALGDISFDDIEWEKTLFYPLPSIRDRLTKELMVNSSVLVSLSDTLAQSNFVPDGNELHLGVGDLALDGLVYCATVLAHELAHRLQLKQARGVSGISRVLAEFEGQKRIELHADFLAGAALRSLEGAGISIVQEYEIQALQDLGPTVPDSILLPHLNPGMKKSHGVNTVTLQFIKSALQSLNAKRDILLRTEDGGKFEVFKGSIRTGAAGRKFSLSDIAMAVINWQILGSTDGLNSSHGSPSERLFAIKLGYDLSGSGLTMDEVFKVGIDRYSLRGLVYE